MTPEKRKEIRDASKREPWLPFLDEFFMDDEIRRILRTPPLGEWGSPPILAIKYVREVKGWSLMPCKAYVEAIRDGESTKEIVAKYKLI